MNTYEINNNAARALNNTAPYVTPEESAVDAAPRSPELVELSRLTDSTALSSLAPRLQAALNEITHPEGDVIGAMRSNVTKLQDGFIDTLYSALNASNVDLSEKITLRLDENELLTVAENRPDKAELDSILARMPELSSAFKEVASQSELLRDISNMSKIMTRSGIAQYDRAAIQQNSTYQISIKGDMSHFYFGK